MNAPVVDPYTLPLEQLDPSSGSLFQQQKHWAYFERLRKEDPVHKLPNSIKLTPIEK